MIGSKNTLPWKLSDDLKYFKKYTLGKSVIMGKNTFVSLGKKPLPKRTNIVLTSTPPKENCHENVRYFKTEKAILEEIKKYPEKEYVIIGGAQVYKTFYQYVTKMVITHVKSTVDGDTLFPVQNFNAFCKKDSISFPKSIKNDFDFKIITYERKKSF